MLQLIVFYLLLLHQFIQKRKASSSKSRSEVNLVGMDLNNSTYNWYCD